MAEIIAYNPKRCIDNLSIPLIDGKTVWELENELEWV